MTERPSMRRLSVAAHAGPLLCVGLLASSCAPSLKNNPPREARTEVPADYGAVPGGEIAASPEAANAAQKKWAEFFHDSQLRTLIEAALKNNQELHIRMQEIIIANSEVMARKGEYLPRLDAGLGVGVDKVGEHTSQGVSDDAHGVSNPLGNFRFGFAASWEVDIWKKLRNAAKAAGMRYLASIEGRNFIVTQLVAEIANSYYETVALDRQLEVLKRNIQIQEDALSIMKLQKQAARVTELAVQRFQAEVLKNQSRRFDLEQRIVEAENRINFLVGRLPQPVARSAQSFAEPVPAVIAAGVPSQLLDNRPDVRQAALELEAAKLDVKVAKARFLPSLSIEAGIGYEAFNPQHIVTTPESMVYNLAGNLTAPLLNRQGIKAQYLAANAQQLQAVFNYERTILEAFTDVANQLAMLKNLQQSYEFESQQVEVLNQSVGVSNVLFQSARADYMEVLLTRRDALDSQMDLIETQLRQRHALVNVYLALGGGWR